MTTATQKKPGRKSPVTSHAKPDVCAPVCLLPDDRMAGRFVALRSLVNREVLASGRNAVRVLAAARKKGVTSPLVFFVPKEEVICMY